MIIMFGQLDEFIIKAKGLMAGECNCNTDKLWPDESTDSEHSSSNCQQQKSIPNRKNFIRFSISFSNVPLVMLSRAGSIKQSGGMYVLVCN